MLKSKIFESGQHLKIQEMIVHFFNNHEDFLTLSTAKSTRAVGDAIQDLLAENFEEIMGDECRNFKSDFTRRDFEDMAFSDSDGFYYAVDVKSHRLDTKFNMPNLTSVARMAKFYHDDKNYFVILKIDYTIEAVKVLVSKATFVPIEFFSWDCLTLGALGIGQIQIADAKSIIINHNYSRKQWMLEFCDKLSVFYPREILKAKKRMLFFEKVRLEWIEKEE